MIRLVAIVALVCGCHHSTTPAVVENNSTASLGLGKPCDAETCAPGVTCMEVTEAFDDGVGGPAVALKACEIRCDESRCPDGTACTTVEDRSFRVCR